MTINTALDTTGMTYSSTGAAQWVPVTHRFSKGGSAMQSGMIEDGDSSTLSMSVAGSTTLSFQWMVASASSADTLSVSLDGTVKQTISGTTGWASASVSIPSGAHIVSWTYTKSTGSHGPEDAGYIDAVSTTSVISVDTIPPVSSAALSGTVGVNSWYTSAVTTTISAVDASSTVSGIKYRLDGGSWTAYSAPIVVSSDGSHIIDYYATDAVGNVETYKTISFKKDSTAPSTTYALDGLTLTLTATDATSGVSKTEYSINGGAWTTYSASFAASTEGVKSTVAFRSIDLAGNVAAATTITIGNADTTAPTTAASPSGTVGSNGWYTSAVSVSLAATDLGGSGLASTYYRMDGGAWTLYAQPVNIAVDGSHVVDYYSVDAAGNIEASKSIAVKKDSAAPASASSVSGLTVTLSASDPVSGVASIYYRIDGGSWTLYTAPFSSGSTGVTHTIDYYAVDSAGNTEAFDQTTAYQASAVTPVAPAKPTSLKAYSVLGGIKLSWTAPLSTGTSPLLGYKVYRSLGSATPVLIGTTTTTSYTDTTLVANQLYRYYVTAYSLAGESAKLGPLTLKLSSIRTASVALASESPSPDLANIDAALVVEEPSVGTSDDAAVMTIAWIMGLPLAAIGLLVAWLYTRHGMG
ncbi:MAG: hypothetical protein A4E32_00092 [Methanomassiliicoccales archaeon PtaU1.Bin124]|nr:MAG: hypothetical protein A4E32_00092 [Methanomassiliicoccales archaeon PtaU1.Bin124]